MVVDQGIAPEDGAAKEQGPASVSFLDPSLRKLWPRLILKLGSTGRSLKQEGS